MIDVYYNHILINGSILPMPYGLRNPGNRKISVICDSDNGKGGIAFLACIFFILNTFLIPQLATAELEILPFLIIYPPSLANPESQ
jgi:hypothetical protein